MASVDIRFGGDNFSVTIPLDKVKVVQERFKDRGCHQRIEELARDDLFKRIRSLSDPSRQRVQQAIRTYAVKVIKESLEEYVKDVKNNEKDPGCYFGRWITITRPYDSTGKLSDCDKDRARQLAYHSLQCVFDSYEF